MKVAELEEQLTELRQYTDGLVGVVRHSAAVLDDARKRRVWTPVREVADELRRNVE